jgi:hypothetical protein
MKTNIIILLLIIPVWAFCQEMRQNQLSITWGAGHLARQDLIFSPMIHRDFSAMHILIGYESKKKAVQNIEFSFSSFNPALTQGSYFEFGEIKTIHPHSLTFVTVYYGLGKQILSNHKIAVDAGGFFHPDIQMLNYVYGRTGPYFGYFASFGLGVFGNIRYQMNSLNRLTAGLRIPLAGWIARSPYLVNDDEFIENTSSHNSFKTFLAFIRDGELAFWNRWQKADLLVQYHHRFTKSITAGAGYRFSILHHTEPRNLLSIENFLTLNLIYHF